MRLHQKSFSVFADYNQFYLWDADMNPEPPLDYSDDDIPRRIKTGEHVVVIMTQRNMTVAVEVEIHDAEPAYDVAAWDHVAEASLLLSTGHLQVHECTGEAVADFSLDKGWYRARAFYGGFDTIDASGLEGEDHYLVALWPAPEQELCVIKQWHA